MYQPRFHPDNSVFVSHFNKESQAQPAAMASVIDQIDSAEAILVVPVIVYREFMEKHHSDHMDQFRSFLKRSNMYVVNITMELAERVEQL